MGSTGKRSLKWCYKL